jgi:Tfp pilus assembly protein PilV
MVIRSSPTPELRRGHTLLEVVLAGTIIAIALVSALRLMRDGLRTSRQTEIRELLTTFGASKLEEHLALVSADWQTGNDAGDFAAEGYPDLRFRVGRSDSAGDGGISDQLMAVTAEVWHDLDGDSAPDGNEPAVVFSSKVAKLASYQDEVGGG